MPFDYPNSPIIGQTVSNGGVSYIWDGSKWLATPNSGGDFVNVSGDTMTGPLVLSGDPTASAQAANKHYIDNAISLAGNYLGTWSVASNSPSITAGGSISNANYVAVTANPAVPETAPGGIPGIAGQTVNNGDRIIWAAGLAVWQILRSPSPGVSSFNTRTGAVTLSSGDVTTVLPPSSTTPVMDGTATIGVGTTWARADHVHPTDTSRASVASVTAGAAAAANNAGRNLVHNALFNVVQRGAGPFTTAAGYTADRWYQSNAGNTVSTTIAALTDPNRAAIGDESALVGFRPVVTGVAGAANQTHITQPIEGVRRLSGKTVTVSFWAWASVGLNLGVSWDQYFGTGGSPSAQVFGTGQVIAITTTPTRYSATFNLPSASGKTIGTNGDDLTELVFAFSTGSTNAAWLGNVGVQSGTFTLWGVQLEIGSVATPLDYGGSPQQQLQQCQRFYQLGGMQFGGYAIAGTNVTVSNVLPLQMRALPTVSMSNNASSNITSPTMSALGGVFYAINFYGPATATGSWVLQANYAASADL